MKFFGGIFLVLVCGAAAAAPNSKLDSGNQLGALFTLPSDKIRVRLFKGLESALIKGFKVSLQNSNSNPQVFKSNKATPISIGINSSVGQFEVGLNKKHKEIWGGNSISIYGRGLTMNGVLVPGELELQLRDSGKFDVIAPLNIDNYLKGVLPSEMPASWPQEALKAQAVASRTYTYFHVKERNKRSYHVDATVMDQVYRFAHPAYSSKVVGSKVMEAIDQTSGWILADNNGDVIPAYYHADCGGKTEEPFYVWSNDRKNGTVYDLSCPLSPNGRWKLSLNKALIGNQIPFPGWETVKRSPAGKSSLVPPKWSRIKITRRTSSGRAQRIRLESDRGHVLHFNSNQFRAKLGYSKLKSTLFVVANGQNTFEFRGQGSGHGVGLCQWGAKNLAQQGLEYKQILNYYYPNFRLKWAAPALQADRVESVKASKSL